MKPAGHPATPNDAPAKGAARRNRLALEAHYRFLIRLIPAGEKFPRRQKFPLGDRIVLRGVKCLRA